MRLAWALTNSADRISTLCAFTPPVVSTEMNHEDGERMSCSESFPEFSSRALVMGAGFGPWAPDLAPES